MKDDLRRAEELVKLLKREKDLWALLAGCQREIGGAVGRMKEGQGMTAAIGK